MGVKLNFLNVILMIFFVIGIIVSAFLLYNLPDTLLKETLIIDRDELPLLLPVLSKVNLVVGATLVIGLSSLLLVLFNAKSKDKNLTASERTGKNRKNGEQSLDSEGESDVESDVEIKEYEDLLAQQQPLDELSNKILATLCKKIEASQAALYFTKISPEKRFLELTGTYAYILPDSQSITYEFGEGLVGQAAKTGNTSHIKAVPEGYIEIFSGLGHSKPGELLIIPIKREKDVISVAEIATFKPLLKKEVQLAEKVFALFGSYLIKNNLTDKPLKEIVENSKAEESAGEESTGEKESNQGEKRKAKSEKPKSSIKQ